MSTNSECDFIEVEPNVWYYFLEDYNAPRNAWDWLEYACAYGPFTSFEAAHKDLGDNHANPGGYGMQPYDKEKPYVTCDQVTRLIKECNERAKAAPPSYPWF